MRLAHTLGVNSSFVSQILSGKKDLSSEQGFRLSQHFEFDELETRYLEELIRYDRAALPQYKKFIHEQLKKIKTEAQTKEGLPPAKDFLDDQSKAIFYSSWIYTAIQLASGLEGDQTLESISTRLHIPPHSVKEALDFLIQTGLCTVNGKTYTVGEKRTHLESSSPLRGRHQMNWRMKGLENQKEGSSESVFFTAPMRIDEKTFQEISEKIKLLIEETTRTATQAGDVVLSCLNIDWFKF